MCIVQWSLFLLAKITIFGGRSEFDVDGGVLASFQYEYDLVKHGQAKAAREELYSLGGGFLFEYGKRLSGGAYYGYPLKASTGTATKCRLPSPSWRLQVRARYATLWKLPAASLPPTACRRVWLRSTQPQQRERLEAAARCCTFGE